MARAAININIGGPVADGRYTPSINSASAPDFATVGANVATLVADGASPTQAHVTTLNTNWTALNASIAGDLSITWDNTKISSMNQFRAAVRAALEAALAGYGGLTP